MCAKSDGCECPSPADSQLDEPNNTFVDSSNTFHHQIWIHFDLPNDIQYKKQSDCTSQTSHCYKQMNIWKLL